MEEQSPFYSMYLSYQANALPPAPEKPLEERVPTPMDDVPKPEPEQKLNVLGEPVEPSELGQTIVEDITDLGRRIVDPFMTSPAVQGPIKGATDLVNQISSLDNELGQVLGVYDRDRQPMQLPDITEDMPVASEGGKELIATLTQFLAPFKAAGGFKAGPLTMESFRAGALADALFDPESGNLWDMAKEQGWVPELTQYLSAKVDEEAPAEDRLMSRLKTVFGEGGPLGVAADGIFKLASMAKKAYFPGKEESLQKVQEEEDILGDLLASFDDLGGKKYSGTKRPVIEEPDEVAQQITPKESVWDEFLPIAEDRSEARFKSKSFVVEYPIDDFLRLADEGEYADKAKRVAGFDKFETYPQLTVQTMKTGVAKVTGHEGRHRARELKKRGYTTMPVEFRSDIDTPIRWSEQGDPKNYDYRELFPKGLVGQDKSLARKERDAVRPFPIKRGDYGIIKTSKGDN